MKEPKIAELKAEIKARRSLRNVSVPSAPTFVLSIPYGAHTRNATEAESGKSRIGGEGNARVSNLKKIMRNEYRRLQEEQSKVLERILQ